MRASQPTSNDACQEAGFTLVEVLVALALMAIMLATITMTYRFGRQAWERVDDMDRAASVHAVQAFLSGLLAQAMPLVERTPTGGQSLVFEGEPHRVRFVANSQGRTVVGGLYLFEITEEEAAGEPSVKHLVVRQTLYRSGMQAHRDKESGAQRREILKNVREVSLRYFGSSPGGWKHGWHDNWTSERELPALIEVRVQFRQGDPRPWPPLVAELKLR